MRHEVEGNGCKSARACQIRLQLFVCLDPELYVDRGKRYKAINKAIKDSNVGGSGGGGCIDGGDGGGDGGVGGGDGDGDVVTARGVESLGWVTVAMVGVESLRLAWLPAMVVTATQAESAAVGAMVVAATVGAWTVAGPWRCGVTTVAVTVVAVVHSYVYHLD